jgi:hypothetical protein
MTSRRGQPRFDWTPHELEIMRMMLENGKSYEEVASAIGRTGGAVRYKASTLGLRDQTRKVYQTGNSTRKPRAPTPSAHETRPCITCNQPFPSEGKHNRMCSNCRAKSGGELKCVFVAAGV